MSRLPNLVPDVMNPIRGVRIVGRLVRRVVKQPGAAPGTLMHTGAKKVDEVRIHGIEYDGERLTEGPLPGVTGLEVSPSPPTIRWINVDGLHDVEVVRGFGDAFGWHLLTLEDIVAVGQRAKAEDYEEYLFAVLPMLAWNAEGRHVVEEQVSLVLGDRYVVTFQERAGDVFEPVRDRLRQGRGRIRARGADYLAYALVDAVVDHYFHVLEQIGDAVEQVEADALAKPGHDTMIRLHELKREILAVRRAVWPVREALAAMIRDEGESFEAETRVFLRDVHDHAVQVAEGVEILRDLVSGAVDLYLSVTSQRANEVMKVLTIMASIFIPLTFFAGIYGMNFEHMPELSVPWAYPALLGFMLTLAGGMVAFFRRRGWF